MALPIRFINLDRAKERRAFMERQGQRLGLALERVRAVEAGEIPVNERTLLSQSWERPLAGPELACFLSHRREWRRVADEGRPALILEDDAVLSRRLAQVLPAAAVLTELDLLNLEDFGRRRFLERGEGELLAAGVRRVRCYRDKAGSGAYILWPSGAQRLLTAARGRAGPADAFIHGAGLSAWVCEPPLVLQVEMLERRGLTAEIKTASSIQAPRERPMKPRGARFLARRAATQLKLLPHHAARLMRADYRRVEIDDQDFT